MGFHPTQFRTIITETLVRAGWYSEDAEENCFAISAHESHLGKYLFQTDGPAVGILGIEPETHKDIWDNCLKFDKNKRDIIAEVCGVKSYNHFALMTNMAYQILLWRVDYMREPEQLPSKDDIWGVAAYWKKFWNSGRGKGTLSRFVRDYSRYA